MHVIENEFLKVSAREYGAELTSILDKKNRLERLWQADPAIWGWHAPVLFPVVGRCLSDTIIIDGTAYPMEKHGFARKSDFKLQDLGDNQMTFSLSHNTETLKSYPFKFEFLIQYRLHRNQLHVTYEVLNKDDKAISYAIGGHPAFKAPLYPGEKYEDYYLQFEANETSVRHLINSDGFFDGSIQPVLNNTDTIHLDGNLFSNDALIFKDLKSRKVWLQSKANPHYLSVDYRDFNYLGLWAKTDAEYVCIEPWLGCADTAGKSVELTQREGVISLAAGQEQVISYIIEVG